MMDTSTSEPLLTYREAATRLAVSERTVWSLVKAGALPAVKIGSAVRVDPVDLAAFIERQKNGA